MIQWIKHFPQIKESCTNAVTTIDCLDKLMIWELLSHICCASYEKSLYKIVATKLNSFWITTICYIASRMLISIGGYWNKKLIYCTWCNIWPFHIVGTNIQQFILLNDSGVAISSASYCTCHKIMLISHQNHWTWLKRGTDWKTDSQMVSVNFFEKVPFITVALF